VVALVLLLRAALRVVEEHEPARVHIALPHAPASPVPEDVGPILLGCS
jgi:hypothetical protein